MSGKCPITFDHASEAHAQNWSSIYDRMRQDCPVAWTESHGGYWVATRFKDVVDIAQRGETFYSKKTYDRETGAVDGGAALPPYPNDPVLPQEAGGEEWKATRGLINRWLAPKAAEARRPMMERFTTALLNRVIETGEMDMVSDLTGPMPAMVTMDLLGMPLARWKDFAEPLHEMVYWPRDSPDFHTKVHRYTDVLASLGDEVRRRRAQPGEDLVSYLTTAEIDGKPLSDEVIEQILANIIAGGVDTTTNLTAHVFKYLSDHPSERQRLIDEPEILPRAREEFIRFFSPVQAQARTVSEEVQVHDAVMAPKERVLLAYASANRDPAVFDRPEELIMDRFPNRHIGFGAGMHRCVGSFLARHMFEVMVQQVLKRIPDYRVINDKAHRYTSIVAINGWIDLPAVFTPGHKIPVDIEL